MKPGRPSLTAQATALVRALEFRRPPGERLLEDRFACGFLDWRARTLLRLLSAQVIGGSTTWLLDRLTSGARNAVVARTLHIDEALRTALAAWASQVVILGAGFDSRALRIPGIEREQVFEVDHPATQERKRSCLARMLPTEPAHVTFVPLDLERGGLEDTMAKAGFLDSARTFFIWEGVTEYLRAEAVHSTLRFVSGAAAGSAIALTYKDARFISARRPLGEARAALRQASFVGEPWTFGLDPTEIASCLATRGLALIEDVGASEREARYLPTSRRPARVGDLDRTALAEVPPR